MLKRKLKMVSFFSSNLHVCSMENRISGLDFSKNLRLMLRAYRPLFIHNVVVSSVEVARDRSHSSLRVQPYWKCGLYWPLLKTKGQTIDICSSSTQTDL